MASLNDKFRAGYVNYLQSPDGSEIMTGNDYLDGEGKKLDLDGMERVTPKYYADPDGNEYAVSDSAMPEFAENNVREGRKVAPMVEMVHDKGPSMRVNAYDQERIKYMKDSGWRDKLDAEPGLAEILADKKTWDWYKDPENLKTLPENMLRGGGAALAEGLNKGLATVGNLALAGGAFVADYLSARSVAASLRQMSRNLHKLSAQWSESIYERYLGEDFADTDRAKELAKKAVGGIGELGGIYALGGPTRLGGGILGKLGLSARAAETATMAGLFGMQGFEKQLADQEAQGKEAYTARSVAAATFAGATQAFTGALYGKLYGLIGREAAGRAIRETYGKMMGRAIVDTFEGGILGAANAAADAGAKAIAGDDVDWEKVPREMLTSFFVGSATVAMTKIPTALGLEIRKARKRYAQAVEAQGMQVLITEEAGIPFAANRESCPDVLAPTINREVAFKDGTVFRPRVIKTPEGVKYSAEIVTADGTILNGQGKVIGKCANRLEYLTAAKGEVRTPAEFLYRQLDPEAANAWRTVDADTGLVTDESVAWMDRMPESVKRWRAWNEGGRQGPAPEIDAEGVAFVSLYNEAAAEGRDNLSRSRAAQIALEAVKEGRMGYVEAAELTDNAYRATEGRVRSLFGAYMRSRSAGEGANNADGPAAAKTQMIAPLEGRYAPKAEAMRQGGALPEAVVDNAKDIVKMIHDGTIEAQTVDVTAIVDYRGRPTEGPLIVRENGDGKYEVVSGKLPEGAKTVKAVIVREEDGWTRANALAIADEANLAEGALTPAEETKANRRTGRPDETGDKLTAENLERLTDDNLEAMTTLGAVVNLATIGKGWEKLQNELAEVMPAGADAPTIGLAAELKVNNPDLAATEAWELAAWARRNGVAARGAEEIRQAMAADAAGHVAVVQPDGEIATVDELEARAGVDKPVDNSITVSESVGELGENSDHTFDMSPVEGLDGVFEVARFPEMQVCTGEGGFLLRGLTPQLMLDRRNRHDMGRFLDQLQARAAAADLVVDLGDPALVEVAQELVENYRYEHREENLKQRTLAAVKVLEKSNLADVTMDEAEFEAALAKYPEGRRYIADGKTWGFFDGRKIYLNRTALGTGIGLNTAIHEFAHPAVTALKKVNPQMYSRMVELAGETKYFEALKASADYAGYSRELLAEEAWVRLIADWGTERVKSNVPAKIYKEVDELVRRFAERFGAETLGVRDFTPAMMATWTIEDYVEAVGSELLAGRPFGSKPPSAHALAALNRLSRYLGYRNPGTPAAKAAWQEVRAAWKGLDANADAKAEIRALAEAGVHNSARARRLAQELQKLIKWDDQRQATAKRMRALAKRNPTAAQQEILKRSLKNYIERGAVNPYGALGFLERNQATGIMAIPANKDNPLWDWWRNFTDGMDWETRRQWMRVLGGKNYKKSNEPGAIGNDHLLERYLDFLNGDARRDSGSARAEERLSLEEFMDQLVEEYGEYQEWKRQGAESLDDKRAREEYEAYMADVFPEGDAAAAERAELELLADADRDARREAERMGEYERAEKLMSFSRGGVSAQTRRAFANDKATADWTVFADPTNIKRLSPQKLAARAPVTEKKDNHSVVAAIRDLFATFGKVKNRSDGNLVVFNRSDAGKMMFNSGADMRMLAPHLKDLFIDAPLAFSNPPHDKGKHPDVVAYKHYINKFTDTDGKDKYIRFTVREHKGGENRHGVHAATVSEVAIYESENAIATGPANNARGSNRVFLDNIISKFLAKSQGESFKFSRPITPAEDAEYADAVKRGDKDTYIRLLKSAAARRGYATPHYFDTHSAPAPAYVEGGKKNFRNLEELRRVHEEDGGDLNLFAMANGISSVPDDYLTRQGLKYYGQEVYGAAAHESLDALLPAVESIRKQMLQAGEVSDMPKVRVYRAVPKTVKEGSLQIEGQWVSPSKTYVKRHGEHRFGHGQYRIIEQEVGADELWFDGNAITEWGFDDGTANVYKNTRHNRKLLEPTYDDAGNLIPLSQRFNDRNADLRFARAGEGERKSRFVAGKVRVADDAGFGEQLPGILAASQELAHGPMPVLQAQGERRRISLPLSELEWLRKKLTGDLGDAVVGRKSSVRGKRLAIDADIFGLVDKTDMAKTKKELMAEGLFAHEDPMWAATHARDEINAMRIRSDNTLADRLSELADKRIDGRLVKGGQSAVRGVFADGLAKIMMKLKPGECMPEGVRRLKSIGAFLEERTAGMEHELESVVGEFYGILPAEDQPRDPNGWRQLATGAYLIAPARMAEIAPGVTAAIEETIISNPKIKEAFEEVYSRNEKGAGAAVADMIRKEQSREHNQLVKELKALATEPIERQGWRKQLQEQVLVALHDRMAPVMLRVNDSMRIYEQARKVALKAAKTDAERKGITDELDRFTHGYETARRKFLLARGAYERGAWNSDSIYLYKLLELENNAKERWQLNEGDISNFLFWRRTVELKGRAVAHGMSVRQAQDQLDQLRATDPEKYARLDEYAQRFSAIIQEEVVQNDSFRRMFGPGFMDYIATQTSYVTMKSTLNSEQVAWYRERLQAAGVDVRDDIYKMLTKWTARGGGGDGDFTAELKGSMSAKAEVRGATMEKHLRAFRSVRRNDYVLALRDLLTTMEVGGVRVLPRGTYPTTARYGFVNYMENGKKFTLQVPRQIADGLERNHYIGVEAIRKLHSIARALFIDYNPGYWLNNINRNASSIEKNIPGIHETWLKTASRIVFPGIAPLSELATQAIARRLSEGSMAHKGLQAILGKHTVAAYLPHAKRIADYIMDQERWQRKLWAAEDADDQEAMLQLLTDREEAYEMLRGNLFVTGAAGHGDIDNSQIEEIFGKRGLKTIEQRRRAELADKKTGNIIRKLGRWSAKPFQLNQRQQEREDVLAKALTYVHLRQMFGDVQAPAESAMLAADKTSIKRGERSGTMTSFVQLAFSQFFNQCEKGIVEFYKNFTEGPWKTRAAQAGKTAQVWLSGLMGMGMSLGWFAKFMLLSADGDEEKAKEKFGLMYDYAKFAQRAFANTSEYLRANYDLCPVMMVGKYTSVHIGLARSDEDKIILGWAWLAARMIDHWFAGGPRVDAFGAAADLTMKGVVPDFQGDTPVMSLIRDIIESMVHNPPDLFRGTKKFDNDTYALRTSSLHMLGRYIWELAANVWNDLGGRMMLEPTVGGRGTPEPDRLADEPGKSKAVEYLHVLLTKIPFAGPMLKRMIKISVGDPLDHDAGLAKENADMLALVRVLKKEALAECKRRGDFWGDVDSDGYSKWLDEQKTKYGMPDYYFEKLQGDVYTEYFQTRDDEISKKADRLDRLREQLER